MNARDDARVGTVLAERYRIDALVGEGGMGRVYAAEHVLMKKRLAVKILRRELTTVPEVVARFEREAMAAASVDHPNVAAATDFGKLPDGSVFLVLEFVQGRSLRDEIAEGPMPIERALHIARQIAAGLGGAHLQGIVHRDLKPENVMLVERAGDVDFVKVLDFGIAKVPVADVAAGKDQPITRAGMVFGTPEYMAPEQALGQAVDGRADLYSLGVILFEMLAGVRPFSSLSAVGILGQQLGGEPPTVAEKAPDVVVPPAVEQIVRRLLDRERDARPLDSGQVVLSIEALLAPVLGRASYPFTLIDGTSEREGMVRVDASARTAHTPIQGLLTEHDERPEEARSVGGLRSAVASVFPPAEALRERLPARLRESLRPVPTRALVALTTGIGVVVAGLLVVVAVAIVRGFSAPVPASSAVANAQSSPRASGSSSALAARPASSVDTLPAALPSPRGAELESQALLASAEAQLAAGEPLGAVNAVARALASDASVGRDSRARLVLREAAQQRVASEPAFALLEGPMREAGADVMWDLAATEQVPAWVRTRAGRWLRGPDFRKAASKSLLLAADLRTAASCEAARALLPAATEHADARSLLQLEAWGKKQGCGKKKQQDCMPCLRQDDALDRTIAAVRARAL